MYHFQKPKWKVILSEHAEEDNDTDVITQITFCEPPWLRRTHADANSETFIQRYNPLPDNLAKEPTTVLELKINYLALKYFSPTLSNKRFL